MQELAMMKSKKIFVMERIMACIPPNPRRVGYIDPIHGLTYTPTPPRSLNYRRSGVQDWTTRKPTPTAV